jgi:hypothetical protein
MAFWQDCNLLLIDGELVAATTLPARPAAG